MIVKIAFRCNFRSPVASPQPPSQLSNNSLNHHHGNLTTTSSGGNGGCPPTGGYHSPSHQLHDQQLLVPHPQLTPGGNDDGISSDCSDDEGSPQDPSHMPVVYPWMKKIHVGGSGKSFKVLSILTAMRLRTTRGSVTRCCNKK